MRQQSQTKCDITIGAGWSIDWQAGTPDWTVPAGAWDWQGQTPIQAIHAAATQHGLVVRPGMAAQSLTILPRYPTLPWHYASATPQLVIHDAAILAVERRKAIESQANAIYVHGGPTGGILAHVKRQYSAADRAAPTASAPSSPILTPPACSVAACSQRNTPNRPSAA